MKRLSRIVIMAFSAGMVLAGHAGLGDEPASGLASGEWQLVDSIDGPDDWDAPAVTPRERPANSEMPTEAEAPREAPTGTEATTAEETTSGISPFRQGLLQRIEVRGSWISDGAHDGLGVAEAGISLSAAIPLDGMTSVLMISPDFHVTTLDAPADLQIPDRLYSTGLNILWRRQLNPRWDLLFSVGCSVQSDFLGGDKEIRLMGMGIAQWQWDPERWRAMFGIVYTGRNDLPILPAAGLTWTPTPNWKVEIAFPRPRVAYRLGYEPKVCEDWAYLGAQLGGGTWSIEREPGISDELTLKDYRLLLGWERIGNGRRGFFVETGYVFSREIEFESDDDTTSFPDAWLISGGVTF